MMVIQSEVSNRIVIVGGRQFNCIHGNVEGQDWVLCGVYLLHESEIT